MVWKDKKIFSDQLFLFGVCVCVCVSVYIFSSLLALIWFSLYKSFSSFSLVILLKFVCWNFSLIVLSFPPSI